MSEHTWFPFEYAPGFIDGKGVVLVRGGHYYPSRLEREDLAWRLYATCDAGYSTADDARKIVKALNAAAANTE